MTTELGLLNRVSSDVGKTALPTERENRALRNVFGIDKPIEFNQQEHDKTMAATIKKSQEVDAINRKAREKREGALGGTTPAQKLADSTKKEHRRLLDEVKNASVRRYQYGEADVNHWQTEVSKWEKLKAEAQSDGNEAQADRALVPAREELVQAKLRLHKYTAEHIRATGLLKAFESEHKIAPANKPQVVGSAE